MYEQCELSFEWLAETNYLIIIKPGSYMLYICYMMQNGWPIIVYIGL